MRDSESSPRGVRGRVLVADAAVVARLAVRALTQAGYECETCSTDPEAICSSLARRTADVVLVDLTSSTAELVRRLRVSHPEVSLILTTTSPNAASAAAAMREGAFDYLIKPFDEEELCVIVGRAIDMRALRRENDDLRRRLAMEERMSFFVAESPAAKQLLALVRRVAATDMILLIEGETGTGKETIARMLHYWSNRSRGPFVIFSFKGAAAAPAAETPTIPFDRAAGGTLFLDEIAEASFATQSELVRFLDEVDVEAGGPAHVRDVRVVAGTSRPLKGEVDAGRFRQDLFFRLSAMPIRIPPLRERREDILVLARRYLSDVAARTGRRLSLTSDAEREMLAYRWPGNVRELRNVIERAAMLTGADFVPSKSLELGTRGDRERGERPPSEHPHPDGTPTSRTEPPTSANPPAEYAPPSSSETAAAPAPPEPEAQPSPEAVSGTLQQCLDIAARVRIKAALETAAGNRAEAAKALDIDAATLNRLIRRLGL